LTKFVSDSFVFVSPERALSYPAQHVRAGDLVFTCWGTIGQVGLIPNDGPFSEYIISNKQLKLRPDPSRTDSVFLFYYFASPPMVEHIRNRAIGSAVPGINLGILKSLPVVLPPLPTQLKIAAILSAYDDLIENNNRRIKLLEQMAQRLYREWFVDFRYPGHENVPLVDSELGPIPQEWHPITLGEWASVVVGSTPSRKVPEYWRDGKVPWINSSQINDLCVIAPTELISEDAYQSTSTKMMPVGTTLVAITGATLGQVSYLAISACGSQNVCGVFSNRPGEAPYLYYAISSAIKSIANRAMGGAQQHINRSIVCEALVVRPDPITLSAFGDIAGQFLSEIVSLLRCQEKLRVTRDLLLPRLMSGEVDVTDLDIAIPEQAG
jgi:type I restriction enzyme S subunit